MSDLPLMARAQREARRRGHRFVSTAHVLLGALADPGDPLGARLRALGEDLEARIEATLPPAGPATEDALPFAPNVRDALEHALAHATEAGRLEIRAEDLLQGLARTAGSRAARVLRDPGRP